jgi:hypothetical protein
MSAIEQGISTLGQQIHVWLPGVPGSFFLVPGMLAVFLALALVLGIVRLFWHACLLLVGAKRRTRSQRAVRIVPRRFYSTDWHLERERWRKDLARRLKS